MFKDEVFIHLRSGDGGDGLVSFRREIFIPKGGPDGGDGGKGGDVVLLGDPQKASLGMFHDHQKFAAGNGGPGGPNRRTGRNGADLVLAVPVGTVIRDAGRGHILKDIDLSGERVVLLPGGRGGRGNARFASPVNRTPRRSEKGAPGAEREVVLELKMIAHVGIIGLPNAGKSTLLSRISKAAPRIADYPFTTLVPELGIVEFGLERYVFADIPGLISGAHLGRGLGDRFLRHIERTRVLLHLIDGGIGGIDEIVAAYGTVMEEIAAYSEKLAAKSQVVALSKADTAAAPPDTASVSSAIGRDVVWFSAHSGRNLDRLLGLVASFLRNADGDDSGAGRPARG